MDSSAAFDAYELGGRVALRLPRTALTAVALQQQEVQYARLTGNRLIFKHDCRGSSAAPDPTFRYSDVMERDKARGTGSLPFLVLPP